MAVSKTIVKMNHLEALVKVVSDASTGGSATIALATDLLKSNENLITIADISPSVHLGAVESSCEINKEITITRNSQVAMNLFENTQQFELAWGADPQNSTSDIVVTFTGKGTVYLRLLKVAGYQSKFRPEQGVN